MWPYNISFVRLWFCFMLLIFALFYDNLDIHLFQYDTKYYYEIGNGDSARQFWFQTPPKIDPDAPYKFGIIGD